MTQPMCLDLDIPASFDGLGEATAALTGYLRSEAISEPGIARVLVVVEEIVTNVIMHGMTDFPQPRMTLQACLAPAGCQLKFEDSGAAFDPTVTVQRAPKPTRLADAKVGGLGLPLIQKLARDQSWCRLPEHRNRLTLTVPLGLNAAHGA